MLGCPSPRGQSLHQGQWGTLIPDREHEMLRARRTPSLDGMDDETDRDVATARGALSALR